MGYAYYIGPLILVAVAVLFWMRPPKKINMIYGYRTTRSMKSQAAWDYAQKYSAKWMIVAGIALFVLSVGAHWLRGRLGMTPELTMAYDIGVTVVLPVVSVIVVIVMTELELRKVSTGQVSTGSDPSVWDGVHRM